MSGRLEKSVPSPEQTAGVLAVSSSPADRGRLREILSQANWKLHEASDCGEALAMLRDQSVPVLLCERDHADGNWEDLLNATARLTAPPKLIVFSRLARRIPLGEGAESGWLRRTDNAFRSGGGLASHIRRLEPVGMRLWCEHRQKHEGCGPPSCIRWKMLSHRPVGRPGP